MPTPSQSTNRDRLSMNKERKATMQRGGGGGEGGCQNAILLYSAKQNCNVNIINDCIQETKDGVTRAKMKSSSVKTKTDGTATTVDRKAPTKQPQVLQP